MRRGLLTLILLLGVSGAQEIGIPVPPRPEGGVLDEARLFESVPERREALEQRVRALRESSGFRAHLVFVDSLIGRTVFEESLRLRDAWLGEEPGLVLVYEVDSGKWEINWTDRSIRAEGLELPASGPSEVGPRKRVAIMSRLKALPEPAVRSREDAERLVGTLLTSLEGATVELPLARRHFGRLILLGVGLAASLLLLAMLIAASVRRADRRAEDRLYFPEIEVGERLKAPRGGGVVSSRIFGPSP